MHMITVIRNLYWRQSIVTICGARRLTCIATPIFGHHSSCGPLCRTPIRVYIYSGYHSKCAYTGVAMVILVLWHTPYKLYNMDNVIQNYTPLIVIIQFLVYPRQVLSLDHVEHVGLTFERCFMLL
jgi:hypothetical protein